MRSYWKTGIQQKWYDKCSGFKGLMILRHGEGRFRLMSSDKDDERIATQRKPNQGSIAGIKILTLNL